MQRKTKQRRSRCVQIFLENAKKNKTKRNETKGKYNLSPPPSPPNASSCTRIAGVSAWRLLAHEDVADSAHSSTDEDEDDQHMEDDEQGQEDQADAELGGVSTAAGVAVDGKVVRRRRPGVIIEEYRANSSSGEEEEESGNEGTGE